MTSPRKSKKKKRQRYVIHEAHLQKWEENYDGDVPPLEGRADALALVDYVKDHLRKEFPVQTVSHTLFEYELGRHSGILRIPIRNHVCVASEIVALATGLASMTTLRIDNPVPENFSAPIGVIDCVTNEFTKALENELSTAKANRRHPDGHKLTQIVFNAIDDARTEAICAAVNALDGSTPDCNRELIQFAYGHRVGTGPPDPFSSKSRFKNGLMEALIWWQFPKEGYREEYLQKSADLVTEDDLTYYFCLIGYLGSSRPSVELVRHEYLDTGGNDRTIRRWLKKYSAPHQNWPDLRETLVTTIRRTCYPLL